MQVISIDTNTITPEVLREVANIYESTGLQKHKAPIKYSFGSIKDILNDHYEDIEIEADDARSELDDVVIGLQGLPDLIKIAIKEIETELNRVILDLEESRALNPTINISAFFDDSLDYITLISKHANNARKSAVAINTTIDPEYKYTELPDYTAIT